MTGSPVRVLDDVAVGDSFWSPSGAAVHRTLESCYDVAPEGTLVYLPTVEGANSRRLVWVDENGREETEPAPPRAYSDPRVSPDGRRIAVTVHDGDSSDIWLWHRGLGTLTQLTSDRATDEVPAWSPDGRFLVFASARDGTPGLFRVAVDGTGGVERVATNPDNRTLHPYGITGDGASVLLWELGTDDFSRRMSKLSLGQQHRRTVIRPDDFGAATPALSPDGAWLTFEARSAGRPAAIDVRPFPDVDAGRWTLSTLGSDPVWSPGGDAVYFRLRGPPRVMRVPFSTEPVGASGLPVVVTDIPYLNARGRQYDVAPDGRLLMVGVAAQGAEALSRFHVVENWHQELLERVPID